MNDPQLSQKNVLIEVCLNGNLIDLDTFQHENPDAPAILEEQTDTLLDVYADGVLYAKGKLALYENQYAIEIQSLV